MEKTWNSGELSQELPAFLNFSKGESQWLSAFNIVSILDRWIVYSEAMAEVLYFSLLLSDKYCMCFKTSEEH